MVYSDIKVADCKERLNETAVLYVKNDGTVNLNIHVCGIAQGISAESSSDVTYMFQSDIEIPVGVEAVITFPASGGEVVVETVSGPPCTVASGGTYAVSDNPNPFWLVSRTKL